MCPACLASLGMLVAAVASAGGLTAVVAAKVRSKKAEAQPQSKGEDHGTEDRIA